MFGFLVGWGVFWLGMWIVVTLLGLFVKDDNITGVGGLGAIVSCIYLLAVFVGKLAAGL